MPKVLKKLIHGVTGLPLIAKAIRLANMGPAVLFYHGVEERLANPKVQTLHLPLADFEKQIFDAMGPILMEQIGEFLAEKSSDREGVCLQKVWV